MTLPLDTFSIGKSEQTYEILLISTQASHLNFDQTANHAATTPKMKVIQFSLLHRYSAEIFHISHHPTTFDSDSDFIYRY